MKVSYNWVKDVCDIDISVEEMSDKLTSIGLVVEEIKQVGNDYCLDTEVTANRPDCLGIIGIARELSAITGCKFKIPVSEEPNEEINSSDDNVKVDDSALCPRYTAQIIENVKVAPSPSWIRERLDTLGIRSVNNVVDITNYVLMESGQPLHAFDLDKLAGKEIVVRRAVNGEEIVAIDGSKHTLNHDMLVIADKVRPVAVAGVMGGIETEVSDNTKSILLECARFEPTNIRKTSKKLGLFSDSSYRFERGLDPEGVYRASIRVADLIKQVAGGRVTGYTDKNSETNEKKSVKLNIERPGKLLGIKIDKVCITDILERLGFVVTSDLGETIELEIPTFRSDVYREVDLIEEIIRIYGYDKIPIKRDIRIGVVGKNMDETASDRTRQLLTAQGLYEVATYSIVETVPQKFDVKFWSDSESLIIKNPLVQNENRLRKTLLHNFLKVKRHNYNRGVRDVNIFEISNVYLPMDGSKQPDEKKCLGLLMDGEFLELKGVVESVINNLSIKEIPEWRHESFNVFDKERSAIIEINGKPAGFMGELNKGISNQYEITGMTSFAEIDFGLLSDKFTDMKPFNVLPSFPGITRDLAIVVDNKTEWADIKRLVLDADVSFYDGIEFFDIYRGKQVDDGKKSVAFSVKFMANDRTLRGEEVDSEINKIIDKLSKELGAMLRT